VELPFGYYWTFPTGTCELPPPRLWGMEDHVTGPHCSCGQRRAPGSSTDLRVLVVDDHPMVRTALSEALSDEDGVTVVGECEDGSDVVEAPRHCAPPTFIRRWSCGPPRAPSNGPRSRPREATHSCRRAREPMHWCTVSAPSRWAAVVVPTACDAVWPDGWSGTGPPVRLSPRHQPAGSLSPSARGSGRVPDRIPPTCRGDR
jgi:hypothetical protein